MRTLGAALLLVAALGALFAPSIAPNPPDRRFANLLNAPPTSIHLRDANGRWQAPFIHPWIRVNQLEQRYAADRSRPVPIEWFEDGHLVRSADDQGAPLLLLGADSFGRDVFSRLLFGARTSLALSMAAALRRCSPGINWRGAGLAGGAMDQGLMRLSELVLLLPAMYVALALRAVMPMVLSPATVFLLLTGIFAVVGAPFIARGVRAIVRTERSLDYAVAATSLGAGDARLVFRHLLPAARGFLVVQLTSWCRRSSSPRRRCRRRPRVSRAGGQLGDDAAGGGENPGDVRLPVALEPRGRCVPRRARVESVPARRTWNSRTARGVASGRGAANRPTGYNNDLRPASSRPRPAALDDRDQHNARDARHLRGSSRMSLLPDIDRILLGPGPSLTAPRVMRAMAAPTVSHLDPLMMALLDDVAAPVDAPVQGARAARSPLRCRAPAPPGVETTVANLVAGRHKHPGDRHRLFRRSAGADV